MLPALLISLILSSHAAVDFSLQGEFALPFPKKQAEKLPPQNLGLGIELHTDGIESELNIHNLRWAGKGVYLSDLFYGYRVGSHRLHTKVKIPLIQPEITVGGKEAAVELRSKPGVELFLPVPYRTTWERVDGKWQWTGQGEWCKQLEEQIGKYFDPKGFEKHFETRFQNLGLLKAPVRKWFEDKRNDLLEQGRKALLGYVREGLDLQRLFPEDLQPFLPEKLELILYPSGRLLGFEIRSAVTKSVIPWVRGKIEKARPSFSLIFPSTSLQRDTSTFGKPVAQLLGKGWRFEDGSLILDPKDAAEQESWNRAAAILAPGTAPKAARFGVAFGKRSAPTLHPWFTVLPDGKTGPGFVDVQTLLQVLDGTETLFSGALYTALEVKGNHGKALYAAIVDKEKKLTPLTTLFGEKILEQFVSGPLLKEKSRVLGLRAFGASQKRNSRSQWAKFLAVDFVW